MSAAKQAIQFKWKALSELTNYISANPNIQNINFSQFLLERMSKYQEEKAINDIKQEEEWFQEDEETKAAAKQILIQQIDEIENAPEFDENSLENEQEQQNQNNNYNDSLVEQITNMKIFWQDYVNRVNSQLPSSLLQIRFSDLGIIKELNELKKQLTTNVRLPKSNQEWSQILASKEAGYYHNIKLIIAFTYYKWKNGVPPSDIEEELAKSNWGTNDNETIQAIIQKWNEDVEGIEGQMTEQYAHQFMTAEPNMNEEEWQQQRIQQNPTVSAINENIQRVNIQQAFEDEYHKYYHLVDHKLQTALQKLGFTVENIQNIAKDLYPPDINQYITQQNQDCKSNLKAKWEDPQFQQGLTAFIQQWEMNYQKRLRIIQQLLDLRMRINDIDQNTFQATKTAYENRYLNNNNIANKELDTDLFGEVQHFETLRIAKETETQKQRFAAQYAAAGLNVDSKELDKIALEYINSDNKQELAAIIEGNIHRQKQTKDNDEITTFTNNLKPVIDQINEINRWIPNTQKVNLTKILKEIQKEQQTNPAGVAQKIKDITDELHVIHANSCDSQYLHHWNEINRTLTQCGRLGEYNKKTDQIMSTIYPNNLKSTTNAHTNFTSWQAEWQTNEVTIATLKNEVVNVIQSQNLPNFSREDVETDIHQKNIEQYLDQKQVMESLNQR